MEVAKREEGAQIARILHILLLIDLSLNSVGVSSLKLELLFSYTVL